MLQIMRSHPFLTLVLGACLVAGCGDRPPRSTTASTQGTAAQAAGHSAPEPNAAAPLFTDVTAASGIDFHHNTGGFGQKWLPETLGPGVVLFDADGDGLLDILFINGTRFPGHPGKATSQAFYRNLGHMRFVEESHQRGLDLEAYCLGGAAGDLDNDGDADLYLSCVGTDHLLWNDDGVFHDGGQAAGLSQQYELGASVALFDADHDGRLDIYATRYVRWTPDGDLYCTLDGKTKAYCTPESYPGASPRYYRNLGGRHFEDDTKKAGLFAPDAKSLGVSVFDLDGDGWSDLAVANDTQPNLLYRNQGDGTFEEIGVASGMAFSETGVARGAMGIDAADYDRTNRPSLVIGNFANEMVALYHNEGNQLFVDFGASSEIGRRTLLSLSFATFFFDYDRDGWLDLLVVNGHLDPDIEKVQPNVRYAEPTQLFRNVGQGRFAEVTDTAGGDLATSRVGRGAAWGDLDGDGDLDVVITNCGGPAELFENRLADGSHWLQLHLLGRQSNPDGLGAEVILTAAGERQRWRVRTGGSYLSQSQVDPYFGLGDAGRVDSVEIQWPSGTTQRLTDVAADQTLTVTEPE
jgi:hypothetical protein